MRSGALISAALGAMLLIGGSLIYMSGWEGTRDVEHDIIDLSLYESPEVALIEQGKYHMLDLYREYKTMKIIGGVAAGCSIILFIVAAALDMKEKKSKKEVLMKKLVE